MFLPLKDLPWPLRRPISSSQGWVCVLRCSFPEHQCGSWLSKGHRGPSGRKAHSAFNSHRICNLSQRKIMFLRCNLLWVNAANTIWLRLVILGNKICTYRVHSINDLFEFSGACHQAAASTLMRQSKQTPSVRVSYWCLIFPAKVPAPVLYTLDHKTQNSAWL